MHNRWVAAEAVGFGYGAFKSLITRKASCRTAAPVQVLKLALTLQVVPLRVGLRYISVLSGRPAAVASWVQFWMLSVDLTV